MRISDWSSDVCSSDLLQSAAIGRRHQGFAGPSGLCHRLHGIAFRLAELLKERLLRRNVFRRPFRIFPVFSEESPAPGRWAPRPRARSEEHTSELQSLMRISYAVFCLKKKKNTKIKSKIAISPIPY